MISLIFVAVGLAPLVITEFVRYKITKHFILKSLRKNK